MTEYRERLAEISLALREVHRLLLQYERRAYEKTFGRIESEFAVLQLAADDPQFAWLQPLSQEIIAIDAARSGKTEVTGVEFDDMTRRIRALLTPAARPTSFYQHYVEARQADPAIIMAHGAVLRSLPPSGDRDVLVMREPGRDERDLGDGLTMSIVRPGDVVPAIGDAGYAALGGIGLIDLPAGTAVTLHVSNEEVRAFATVPTTWNGGDGGRSLDPGDVAVVATGSATDVTFRAEENGTVGLAFIRPEELARARVDSGTVPARRDVAMSVSQLAPGYSHYVDLPDDWQLLVFMMEGDVTLGEVTVSRGELALVRDQGPIDITSLTACMFLAICLQPTAKITRAGGFAR